MSTPMLGIESHGVSLKCMTLSRWEIVSRDVSPFFANLGTPVTSTDRAPRVFSKLDSRFFSFYGAAILRRRVHPRYFLSLFSLIIIIIDRIHGNNRWEVLFLRFCNRDQTRVVSFNMKRKKEKRLVYKIAFAIWRMVLLDARKEKEKVKLQSCYLHNVKR